MGLRERNAARTREMIIDTALTLFLERGYEATKMEDVAEAAGIGTSTLYRYFPTKDLLLIEPLAFRGKFVENFRSRPAEEPLEMALGNAVMELFAASRGDRERLRRISAVVDSAAVPRMRLLDEFVKERTLLEAAIAERLGRSAEDVFCVMTARTTAAVMEYIAELTRGFAGDEAAAAENARQVFRSVTGQLALEPPALPVLSPAT
jgi:AcrR family transcriptional regulator